MPGTARRDFLNGVRQALGRSESLTEAPVPLEGSPTAAEVEARAEAIHQRLSAKAPELAEALAGAAERAGWKVCRAATPEDALDYLAALAERENATTAVRSSHEVFDRMDVDGALKRAGVAVFEQSRATGGGEGRDEAASAGLGVTGVDYAIADLGSCVIRPREGISRTTSLLPPVHVAIVAPGQVVEDLSDLMALWAADAQRAGDPGSYLNIITGPSRTADIEQILVVGVHGPKEVHMIVLGS